MLLHYETPTATGAPGMSVRQAARKRKSEMRGKESVRSGERDQAVHLTS